MQIFICVISSSVVVSNIHSFLLLTNSWAHLYTSTNTWRGKTKQNGERVCVLSCSGCLQSFQSHVSICWGHIISVSLSFAYVFPVRLLCDLLEVHVSLFQIDWILSFIVVLVCLENFPFLVVILTWKRRRREQSRVATVNIFQWNHSQQLFGQVHYSDCFFCFAM